MSVLQQPRSVAGMRVGAASIGPQARVYLIAEAGVNHNGDLDTALRMVDVAADVGVDAVKFQCFRAEGLASKSALAAEYQQAGGVTSQCEMLARLELADAHFLRLRSHCEDRGVEFLATPFSIEDVRRVVGFGARALKIASTDLNNAPLLQAVVETNLPLFVSTGAATRMEIAQAHAWLKAWGAAERLALLHCVSCYPAPVHSLNLRAIHELARTFCCPAGFSDHSLSAQTGAWAVASGACVLEKHFTLDRNADGPDHAMSLEPEDLRQYVALAREAESARGAGELGMNPLEAETRRVARKSIVAACEIAAGALITPEMLTLKRPDGGVAPADLPRLIGRRLRCDVAADTVLTWDLVV